MRLPGYILERRELASVCAPQSPVSHNVRVLFLISAGEAHNEKSGAE